MQMISKIFGFLLSAVMQSGADSDTDYSLMIIQDEEVPLSNSIQQDQLFPYALAAILIIIVLLAFLIYFLRLHRERKRFTELQYRLHGSRKLSGTWNLIKLRRTIRDMETDLAENIITN